MFVALVVSLAAVVAAGAWFVLGPRAVSTRSAGTGAVEAPAVEAWTGSDAPQVLVVNRSPHPVHEVRAYVALGRGRRPTCVGWIRTLPPTGEEAARVALTADSREEWWRWRNARSGGRLDVAVELTFCDHEGQHWRRDRSGVLTAIDG